MITADHDLDQLSMFPADFHSARCIAQPIIMVKVSNDPERLRMDQVLHIKLSKHELYLSIFKEIAFLSGAPSF